MKPREDPVSQVHVFDLRVTTRMDADTTARLIESAINAGAPQALDEARVDLNFAATFRRDAPPPDVHDDDPLFGGAASARPMTPRASKGAEFSE